MSETSILHYKAHVVLYDVFDVDLICFRVVLNMGSFVK